MTDPLNANENKTPEELKALIQECNQDMQKISAFAGGLTKVEENLKSDLHEVSEAKKAVLEATKGFNQSKTSTQAASEKLQVAQDELDAKIKKANETHATLESLVNSLNEIKTNAQNVYQSSKTDAEEKLKDLQVIVDGAEELFVKNGKTTQHIGEQKIKVDADVQTVLDTKVRFEELKKQAEELSAQLSSKQTDLQNQTNDIQGKLATLQGLEKQLSSLKDSALSSKNGIDQTFAAIGEQKKVFEDGIAQTNQKNTDLTAQQSLLQQKFDDIDEKHKKIQGWFAEVMVDVKDSSGQTVTKSLKTLVTELHVASEERLSGIAAEQQTQVEAFKKLAVELRDKVERLLPSAGAAGLASSYYGAKLRYSPTNDIVTEFDGEKRPGLPWYKFLSQFLSLAINYALFIIPLWTIYDKFSSMDPAIFKELSAALLYKVTLTIPMLGISGFGLASILSNRQLYEEYNHKQRVMELYHSFKGEIKSASDPELKIKLLNLMVDVVRDKPSSPDKPHKDGLLRKFQETLGEIAEKVGVKV